MLGYHPHVKRLVDTPVLYLSGLTIWSMQSNKVRMFGEVKLLCSSKSTKK